MRSDLFWVWKLPKNNLWCKTLLVFSLFYREMCVNMPLLQILIVILTVECVVSDNFTEPESNRTDLAFRSKIHASAVCMTTSCTSNYCVGRSDDPSDPVKILNDTMLSSEISTYTLTFWVYNNCTSSSNWWVCLHFF